MSKKGKQHQYHPPSRPNLPVVTSLLDHMEDGREFESLLNVKAVNLDVADEIRKAIADIEKIRERPIVCYLANVVNKDIKASTAIEHRDDLPFAEMLSSVPVEEKAVDVVLVTPGGLAQQVSKFVDRLRPRFDHVGFVLPDMAMSAGTIFVMSGDEIMMDERAYIGPIDPQVLNKDGAFVPAQAIITLIREIQERGQKAIESNQNPMWTDLQILRQIDAKDIGNAMNASAYSIELVENYLTNYKFKHWEKHESTGALVTIEEKKARAHEIAMTLCDHEQWKTHSRGITRDAAWQECKLKIGRPEDTPGLDRAIRRLWALVYWCFENTPIYKMFISTQYCIFRHQRDTSGK